MQPRLASSASPDASAVPVGTLIEERPPPGLARGKYAAPPWLIGTLGTLLVLAALTYLVLQFWKRRA